MITCQVSKITLYSIVFFLLTRPRTRGGGHFHVRFSKTHVRFSKIHVRFLKNQIFPKKSPFGRFPTVYFSVFRDKKLEIFIALRAIFCTTIGYWQGSRTNSAWSGTNLVRIPTFTQRSTVGTGTRLSGLVPTWYAYQLDTSGTDLVRVPTLPGLVGTRTNSISNWTEYTESCRSWITLYYKFRIACAQTYSRTWSG